MASKIYESMQNVLVAILMIFIIGMLVMMCAFKISPLVVMSGSMEPELPVGSICLVDRKATSPEIGDIISFKAGEVIVTHRIVAVNNGNYVTKGDSNKTADPGSVNPRKVMGTEFLCIPMVGYLVVFLKSLKGIIVVATILLCFILLGLLARMNKKE